MREIFSGLSYLHEIGIVHRDIKLDNIMMNIPTLETSIDYAIPKLIDFGLATVADDPNYLFVRCGTPGYVAPEIINIKDMSTKSHPISDVFSVGCIFYYIIFSKHLFMGKTGQ